MFDFRKMKLEDLPRIEEIYLHARHQMKADGNPDQWGDYWPDTEEILKDIQEHTGYVALHGGQIVGVFAWIIGEDPTYQRINGDWTSSAPYGTIHRIASSGEVPGIFKAVLEFVEQDGVDIRIDTHEKNTRMRHLVLKYGFTYCGIIYCHNGTERLAYIKKKEQQI